MAIDLTNISALQSAMTTYSTNNSTGSTATNFSDYLMQAFDTSKNSKQQQSTNGLYDLLSNSSSSSVMQSLLGTGSSSVVTQYLQSGNTSSGLQETNANLASSATEMFSDYLQSSFQSSITKSMTAAKAKLQTDLDNYKASNKLSNSDVITNRIQQMEQNIAYVDSFLQTKTAEQSTTSTNDQLMQLLSSNGANAKYLFTNKS